MTEELSPAERRILQEVDRHSGYISQADVIRPHALRTLMERGILERVRRGLYRRSDLEVDGELGLLDAAAAVPHGVICLVSALALHELTTQVPWEIYMAIPRNSKPPQMEYPSIRFVRYGDRIFDYGIQVHRFPDAPRTARVYSPEKSIADAVHFQRIIGPDVAVEAIREYMRRPNRDLLALRDAARVCGVSTEIEAMMRALA